MSDPTTDQPSRPAIPVQPLEYSSYTPRAPGLITAIGVISIVVASLSLINAMGCGFQMAMVTWMSRMTAGGAVDDGTVVEIARPYGLEAEQRDVVIGALGEVQPLTDVQRQHLDALLKEAGQRVFRVPAEALTADLVRNNVTSSREVEGDGGAVTHFVIGEGRLAISQTEATFRPDGAQFPITAMWEDDEAGGLDDEQIEKVIARIEELLGEPLNEAQLEGVRELLADPAQEVIATDNEFGFPPEAQVSSAWTTNRGVTFHTFNGWVMIEADGQTQVNSFGGPFVGGPVFSGTVIAAGWSALLVNSALAIYLLVIGILTLRQHPRGGQLHMIYALLKIPASVVFGVGMAWMVLELMDASPGPSGPAEWWFAVLYAGGMAVLGSIYPIALLIALRTRTIREYYGSVHEAPAGQGG